MKPVPVSLQLWSLRDDVRRCEVMRFGRIVQQPHLGPASANNPGRFSRGGVQISCRSEAHELPLEVPSAWAVHTRYPSSVVPS